MDTLQGIAAIDGANRKATILIGGGSQDIDLTVTGVPATFGQTVNVVVREDRPPVVLSTTTSVSDGELGVTVPNDDRYSAYQVVITPGTATVASVDTGLVDSTEAENATLTAVCPVYKDPAAEWSHLASGSHDVGCVNDPTSEIAWEVTVPRAGTYRVSILGGANQSPGKQALFVDGAVDQIVDYPADQGWEYRGTTYATIRLSQGTPALSLRPSEDGSTLLPGSDITVDRLDLYDVTDGEQSEYPAMDARLAGGATISYASARTSGSAALRGDASDTFFTATVGTGYYDVSVEFTTTRSSAVRLGVNGRQVELPSARSAGTWTSTVRLYLAEGINEFVVSSPEGALLSGLRTVRGPEQQASDQDSQYVVRYEATDLQLTGTASVAALAEESNGSGGYDVEWLGMSADSTATAERPEGFAAGDYQLVLSASNADMSTAINYDAQVISRVVQVSEAGGNTVQATVRHNHSGQSLWNQMGR